MVENKGERSIKTGVCRALSHIKTLDFIPSMMRSSFRVLSKGDTRYDVFFLKDHPGLFVENGSKNEGSERQFRGVLLSSRQEMIVACTRAGVVGVVRVDRLKTN